MRARLSKKYDTSDNDYGGRRINPGMRLTGTSAALKSTMYGKSMARKQTATSEIDVNQIVADLTGFTNSLPPCPTESEIPSTISQFLVSVTSEYVP